MCKSSVIKCNKCGGIVEDGKNFCPDCGNSLERNIKKTGKPIAGGILIIIASVFCLIAGIFILLSYNDFYYYPREVLLVIPFAFEVWGFSIGLFAGICAIKRIHFAISIIGCSFVIVGGFMSLSMGSWFVIGLIFLIIILVLAILGTIFIAISKNEFQKK